MRSFVGSLVALALVVSGCIQPVRRIAEGEPVALAEGEGIVVVHVTTDSAIRELRYGRKSLEADLDAGEHLLLVVFPAGRHRLRRVQFRDDRRIYPLPSRSRDFTVEEGRVNFIGMVEVDRYQRSGGPLLRRIDRTAIELSRVELTFPGLLCDYPALYQGSARHEFLPRYLEARAQSSPDARDAGTCR
jgi:hypothetical protein